MSKDIFSIEGIFTLKLWEPDQFDWYVKRNKQITAAGLSAAGFKPIDEMVKKNAITDDGLRWHRGQIMKTTKYMSLMGELALIGDYGLEVKDGSGNTIRKKLVLSEGSEPGTLIQDASWDTTQANGNQITGLSIYTYTDGTTPAGAIASLYAQTNLKPFFNKTSGTALTVTRYEYLKRV